MQIRLVLLLGGLCLANLAGAVENCASLEQAFHQAMNGGRLDGAEAQLKNIQRVCPLSSLRDDESFFTDSLATLANDLAEKKQCAQAENLLKKARLDAWTVSSVRGYIASQCPGKDGKIDWQEVSSHYGHALELLTDPNNPKLKDIPDLKQHQTRILALATDAQLLYGKADATIQRDGSPRGVLLAAVRGIKVGAVPYPVHFDTDKASLTADGKHSADVLAQFILGQPQFQAVTLTGHADPRGSVEHNQQLSEDRAKTVADYLVRKGVNVTIKPCGKGESQPPDTAFDHLSEQEEFSRWRRVELDFQ